MFGRGFPPDADERAAIDAAVADALGQLYDFKVIGDGETWVSVECVPARSDPPGHAHPPSPP